MLLRDRDRLEADAIIHDLTPGTLYEIRWLVFYDPDSCVSGEQEFGSGLRCGGQDLPFADSGRDKTSFFVPVGRDFVAADSTVEIAGEILSPDTPANIFSGGEGNSAAVLDLDGLATAEVHLVLRENGDAGINAMVAGFPAP